MGNFDTIPVNTKQFVCIFLTLCHHLPEKENRFDLTPDVGAISAEELLKSDHIWIQAWRVLSSHGVVVRGMWEMKWNESGFRPPLCTYRLNWARRTSWGWWDDWDDTVLQTQDSKFEPWRSEAEHATSRSRRLPTILTFTRGWGRNNCFFQTAEPGNRTPDSGVKGSGANHYPRAPALEVCEDLPQIYILNVLLKLI